MGKTSEGLSLIDLIPRDRLTRYLNTTSMFLKAPLRVLDLSGVTVMESCLKSDTGANVGRPCPPDAWAGVCSVLGDGPMVLSLDEGFRLMAAPLVYKGQPLGYLSACLNGTGDHAMPLLSLSVSHLESLAEAGVDVESLSGEVVRVYEELALIYGLTARLGARVDIDEICRVVVDEAKRVLDPTDIVLQLADLKAGVFRTSLACGAHEDLALAFSPALEEGLIGQAYTEHRSVIVCEVEESRHHKPWPFPIRRIIAVPLVAEGSVIGVISATDKRNGDEFNSREEKLISAISSVGAIAIKNAQLYSEIKDLFEGFIEASVTAVEARDPATAGHSKRVAAMVVELAKRVSESDLPPFKGIFFSREQLIELRYAALLHDFGKIGVRESVLLKESKLPHCTQVELASRFDYIKLQKRYESIEKKLDPLLREGPDAYLAAATMADTELAAELEKLDKYQKLIWLANDPRVLFADLPELAGLTEVAEQHYTGPDGSLHPYLTQEELSYLHVQRGSLSKEERREVEEHVTHSYNFLTKIPWTASFPDIARIAYTHHEKMDGSGYPLGLKKDDIPLQARMIAVVDIFDALTAWNRPYKNPLSTEKALFILELEVSDGKLDPHLVQLFRDTKVYKSSCMINQSAVRKRSEA